MHTTHLALVSLLSCLGVMTPALSLAKASSKEHTPEQASPRQRSTHFISTSAFMLGNLLPKSPWFAQLNYGFRPTDEDTILVEAITWRYWAPLGIPYGPDLGNDTHDFPGYVQAVGVGLAYQRYLWRGLFGTLHATPLWQTFYDEDGRRLQSGFQLFAVARLGYHFELWKGRVFIEPSIAVTSWFINTNLPKSFQVQESKWPSVFLPEPGLNIGFNW